MAIDTTVGEFEYPGEEDLGTPQRLPGSGRRSDWLRPNVLWAMAGAVIGYLIGHWLGNVIASGYEQVQTAQNDVAIVLGLSLGVLGWMAGIGALNYPLAKVLGYELSPAPPQQSWVRYFRMTDDHKVVGMQYAVGVLLVPLHRRPAGHAHPDRAAEPDQPRLRSRDLHRHRRRARHDHDDDGLLGRDRAARATG